MKKWILSGFVLVFYSFICIADVPELIDLKLVGPKEDAQFEPNHIELIEGDSYILIIDNPYDYTYSFEAASFPGAIRTQYIQGSPSVTKTSVHIAPNSKVQWVFRAQNAGKHEFIAKTYGIKSHKHKPGYIVISPLVPDENIAKADLQTNTPLDVEVPTPELIASLNQDNKLANKSNSSKERKQPHWGGRR